MVEQLRKVAWLAVYACLVTGVGFAVWSVSSTAEDSEYWMLLGHKLKITDTLLAVFAFALIPIGFA
jgi:hypothetical protein